MLSFCLQDSCQKTNGCTAVNWKHEGNHECILRACSLPVVPPIKSLSKWKAFYVTTPTTTTTTTTTTATTTTNPIIDGLYFLSNQPVCVYFLTPYFKDEVIETISSRKNPKQLDDQKTKKHAIFNTSSMSLLIK